MKYLSGLRLVSIHALSDSLLSQFLVVSGETMFDILPPELKSLAVRSKVKYAPHPYVWMAPSQSNSTGLGLVSAGKELPLSELPEWSEDKVKAYPVVNFFPFIIDRLSLKFIALEKSCYWWSSFPSSPFWCSRSHHCTSSRRCIQGGSIVP